MKYFLHDSNAFNDEKITALFIDFGYEGLGLFYTLLEKLAQQEKPIKTSVLKHQLKVGKRLEKCWKFMESIGLISSNNGETFNKQLLNFSEKYKIKKEKNAERISEWRKKQEDTENVTCYKDVRNTPKVKESKVNESKENINNIKGDCFENEFEPEILEDNIIPLQTEKEKKEKEKTSGQKEKETKPEFSLDDVIWPFESKEFDSTWMLWLSYRKERGLAKYKPIGLQACLKDLAKISDGSESKAIDIIHNAIAKNWQGLFPIRENNQNNGRNQTRFTQEGLAAAVYAKWGKTGN